MRCSYTVALFLQLHCHISIYPSFPCYRDCNKAKFSKIKLKNTSRRFLIRLVDQGTGRFWKRQKLEFCLIAFSVGSCISNRLTFNQILVFDFEHGAEDARKDRLIIMDNKSSSWHSCKRCSPGIPTGTLPLACSTPCRNRTQCNLLETKCRKKRQDSCQCKL